MAGVDVGTAYLTVVPSAKGFAGKLQSELGGGMSAAGSKAGADASKGFGSSFKAGIGTAAKAGALVLAGVAAGGIAFAKSAISEARESQKVGALTAQVIKSTGGAAKVSAGQVGDLATAISNKTGIDDEAIQSGANMLLTFKNIRNEAGKGNDIFNQSTSILTDLATAMGSDPQKAAIQLGKALNDPVKGVSALSRVGVTFDDQQKKTIAALVKGGKTAEAQKIILKELSSEFGGAAEASATMGEKAATSFGNLKEQIGTALLPYLDRAEKLIVEKVIPAVSKFFAEMQSGTGKGGAFVGFLKDAASKLQFLADHAKTIGTVLAVAAGGWVTFRVAAIAYNVVQLISLALLKAQTVGTIENAVATKAAAVATKIFAAGQFLLNAALTANPIGVVVVAIALLVGALVIAYRKSSVFRDVVNNAWDTVKVGALTMALFIVKAVRGMTNAFLTAVGAIVTGAAKAFGWVPGIGPKLKGAAEKIAGFKESANASLGKVEKSLQIQVDTAKADAKINDFRRRQSASIKAFFDVTTRTTGRVTVNGVATNAGQRASGGPVSANSPYWVGENRDGSLNKTSELFVPKTGGTVLNQQQLSAMGIGGGGSVHVGTVVAHDYNDFVSQMDRQKRRKALRGI